MSDPIPVDPMDSSKQNSEILSATADEATVSMEQMDAGCFWNGTEYKQGQRVDAAGSCYECSFGHWVPIE